MKVTKAKIRMKALISMMVMVAVLMVTMAGTAGSVLAADSGAAITKAQAKSLALKDAHVKKSKAKKLKCKFEKDDEDGNQYEVSFRTKRYEYEYEIIAESGIIREREIKPVRQEDKSGEEIISKKFARKKALKHSGTKKPKKLKVKKETDDGYRIWEVTFRKGDYKYTYKVSRVTGRFLKMEYQLV